ncbi:hypothetical protein IT157_02285 [bacterium]|nr:hypothetical protein [bacterium]
MTAHPHKDWKISVRLRILHLSECALILRTYLEIAASVAEQGLSATNLPEPAENYAMSRGSLPESDALLLF